jgi:methylated-DNA-[protein]-cysteine S-methyltransferase
MALVVIGLKKKFIPFIPFGPIAVVWGLFDDSPKIVRVVLSTPEVSAKDRVSQLYPECEISSCADINGVAKAIEGFLEGDNIRFSLDVAQLSICSSFQQSVLKAEHQIPRGCVSTYQLIALYLGNPNGARAVGNALAHNPFPIIIPCHRAIRSDCSLGGFQGGLNMKRTLLSKEGISFDDAGRVLAPRLYYDREKNN